MLCGFRLELSEKPPKKTASPPLVTELVVTAVLVPDPVFVALGGPDARPANAIALT
jgi:hypothetical protein